MLSMKYGNWMKDDVTRKWIKKGDLIYNVMKSDVEDNVLLFDKNGFIKKVIVRHDKNGYVYKFYRQYITADGGRDGLYSFLEKEIRDLPLTGGFFYTVCNKVFSFMK